MLNIKNIHKEGLIMANQTQILIVREMLEKDTRSCYREHRDFFKKSINR